MRVKQHRFWFLFIMSILVLTGLLSKTASGQSTEQYRIERSALNAGGGTWATSNHRIKGSLGQLSKTRISVSDNAVRSSELSAGDAALSGQLSEDSVPTTDSDMFIPEISGSESALTPSSLSEVQTPAPVPEPGTFALFAAGMIGMVLFMKRIGMKRR